MKTSHILKGIFIAFLALQFYSCENEPLEGEFPPRNDQNDSTQVQFEALINGERFVANTTTATISEEGYLVMSGEKSSGEKITLKVSGVTEGAFPLMGGQDDREVGLYFPNAGATPYTTSEEYGGSGTLVVDSLGVTTRRLSGTFNMQGVRPELDAMGNPVLDGNGDPIIEEVLITEGIFRNIGYEIGGDPGSGGNTGDHEFFARVDDIGFPAESIEVTETVVGGINMIQIKAKNEDRDIIRIDVPLHFGVDTYGMEPISNGSVLFGSYKANGEDILTSDPGTLTITEFDKEQGVLVASFEFTARDPLGEDPRVVNITLGQMKIYFEGVPGGNNIYFAKINETPYRPNSILIDTEVVEELDRFVVEAIHGDETMTLSFPQSVVEGNTYPMRPEATAGNEVVGVYRLEEGGIPFSSEMGEMTITLYDRENGIIEGVFEYTATDMTAGDPTIYRVTEGNFKVWIP